MTRVVLLCLTAMAVLAFVVEARIKTRTLFKAQKEVRRLRDLLKNKDGREQWKASFEHSFALKEDDEIPMGVIAESGKVRALRVTPPNNRIVPIKPGKTAPDNDKVKLPDTYDSRTIWGQRCPSYNYIMNQGACGNCWAVAIAAMINDRTCQYNKEGEPEFFHSAKHLTTCQAKGCNGGWFANGLDYWIQNGLPTGGDYGVDVAGCKPFPDDAGTKLLKNETCSATCDDGSPLTKAPHSFGGARYQIQGRAGAQIEQEIMEEIYLYGPIIATFDVYDDFAHYYKGGVYKRVSDKFLGGHATKLFGWGTENGIKFWYAANSWGDDWGEVGFFKIQRGTNECNVETNLYAAVPKQGLDLDRTRGR